MTDHTQLRKLAEAAKASAAWYEHYRAYIEAVENPQTVIELLDEIERLKKDAERLNWIQRNLFGHKWNGVIGPDSQVNWSIWSGFRNVTVNMIGDTFRSAIDAAMVK